MKKERLIILAALIIAAIIVCIVCWTIAIIGAMDLTDGCLYRYNDSSGATTTDKLSNTVTLKANANYTALSSETSGSNIALDPTTYGKWLNTNLRLKGGQKVIFEIKGDVSLCKAYLPSYNLQSNSGLDISGERIEIPRVEDKLATPVTLTFDAKTDEWRNITQLFKNDKVVVSLHKDKKTTLPTSTIYDSIQKQTVNADCREGQTAYSPICGRYSIYSGSYVSSCGWNSSCYDCNCHQVCKGWDILGVCIKGYKTVCNRCGCWFTNYGNAPEPYKNDGTYTSPWSDNLGSLFTNFSRSCSSEASYINGAYQNERYFWFSADTATGLLYRFDSNLDPTSKKNRGSVYAFAQIQNDQSYLQGGEDYQIIMDTTYTATDVAYLQYRFHDNDSAFGDNTGGYVLNVKQTKCRRSNGNAFNDTVASRGIVQYIIADYGKNPNNDTTGLTTSNILTDVNGSGSITAASNQEGYLWLKIKNDPNDYKDSFGQYQVQFFSEVEKGSFYSDVLGPFLQGFKEKIQNAYSTIFKNMTCYKGTGGAGNCTNFFSYIKAMLTIYIMLYGMMFLLGMVQISQTDLVIRVIKVAFVAGLMSDSTFEFFKTYVFDFVTQFSDEIIANMSGYSMFSGSATISNPLMFMNEVMTRILLSSTFVAQMMAMLSMGLNGVIYFIIIFVCIGIILLVLFRSIAIYLMAYMAIAVLMGLAPLFLTFILFNRTWYLFDNWVKFTFRYLIEPVILLAGVIILTQLITIYLDYAIGYSVCWKCALPIKLPFATIPGITPAFLDVEMFCINWFVPWGFDHRSSQMGLSMQNIAVLLMLAYCLWGYVDFSEKIVGRIAGGVGGPSATSMGMSMANKAEDNALKELGLDAESRAMMKKQAGAVIDGLRNGDKNSPRTDGNRHDVEPSQGSKNGPGGSGRQASSREGGQGSNASGAQSSSSWQGVSTGNDRPGSSGSSNENRATSSAGNNKTSGAPKPPQRQSALSGQLETERNRAAAAMQLEEKQRRDIAEAQLETEERRAAAQLEAEERRSTEAGQSEVNKDNRDALGNNNPSSVQRPGIGTPKEQAKDDWNDNNENNDK